MQEPLLCSRVFPVEKTESKVDIQLSPALGGASQEAHEVSPDWTHMRKLQSLMMEFDWDGEGRQVF